MSRSIVLEGTPPCSRRQYRKRDAQRSQFGDENGSRTTELDVCHKGTFCGVDILLDLPASSDRLEASPE